MTNQKIAVLGASDPEMKRIEYLFEDTGFRIVYASVKGQLCHPGSAYQADNIPEGVDVAVECGPAPAGAHIIDHHREGDPGYGKPPEDFWEASSVGQVYTYLIDTGDVDPLTNVPMDHVFAAAADHCLAAAYQGQCPGVDPEQLMEWRIKERAEFQRKDPAALLVMVNKTRARLRRLVNNGIVDLTNEPQGTLPEAPEAAAREGVAVIARVAVRGGGQKLVMLGATTPELITSWLDTQKAKGRKTYGDPARGFAGAYLTDED